MSSDRPTAEELGQGTTVGLVQEDADVEPTDECPLGSEIATIYGDHPDGPDVTLKTGVVGHAQSVVSDA